MHPLLHSFTAYKLYPENVVIIISSFIPDTKVVKRLLHGRIYFGSNPTVESVYETIEDIKARITEDEALGIAIHLLGDLWWEENIRILFKGFSLFYRRCIETSWAMTYLKEMYPNQGRFLYKLLKEHRTDMLEIVKRLIDDVINENEVLADITEGIEHYVDPRISFRRVIPKIEEFHEIIYEKFDLDSLLSFIREHIKKSNEKRQF
ncbi:MAG: hypothetical protein ABGF52_01740 [Candidatus Asgardarchaeum sp.]